MDSSTETVSQCLELLRQKDDTSCFVGLAILLSLLNRIDQKNPLLSTLWDALDARFLDRLLKSAGTNKPPDEVDQMMCLAVHVIHAFAISLPNAAENQRLIERIPPLIDTLNHISKSEIPTVLETLFMLATGEKGAVCILNTHNIALLVKLSEDYPSAVQVLQYSIINGSSSEQSSKIEAVLSSICKTLEESGPSFRLSLLSLLKEVLSRLSSELLPRNTQWAKSLFQICIMPTQPGDSNQQEWFYRVVIVASLLHAYQPSLFFESVASDTLSTTGTSYVHLYLQLTTVDLRAAFSSLMEQLSSSSYSSLAQRLAADFDVVTAFLGYILDTDEDEGIKIDPDLLLKLRGDLRDTFGLTVEFLRDRWDTAMGSNESETAFKQSKALPWGSIELEKDPVIMSAVRALSLWVKEDDCHRKEAGGLMDILLRLWAKGMEANIDYRKWVLGALEGVLEEEHGQDEFLRNDGWELVWKDLKDTSTSKDSVGNDTLKLAIDEAMLLADVIKSMRHETRTRAIEVIRLRDITGSHNNSLCIELDAALLHLKGSCLTSLSRNDWRSLSEEIGEMAKACEKLKAAVHRGLADSYVLDIVQVVDEQLDVVRDGLQIR